MKTITLVVAMILPALALAQTPTIHIHEPEVVELSDVNQFSPGTPAKAGEVNDNFRDVIAAMNSHAFALFDVRDHLLDFRQRLEALEATPPPTEFHGLCYAVKYMRSHLAAFEELTGEITRDPEAGGLESGGGWLVFDEGAGNTGTLILGGTRIRADFQEDFSQDTGDIGDRMTRTLLDSAITWSGFGTLVRIDYDNLKGVRVSEALHVTPDSSVLYNSNRGVDEADQGDGRVRLEGFGDVLIGSRAPCDTATQSIAAMRGQ